MIHDRWSMAALAPFLTTVNLFCWHLTGGGPKGGGIWTWRIKKDACCLLREKPRTKLTVCLKHNQMFDIKLQSDREEKGLCLYSRSAHTAECKVGNVLCIYLCLSFIGVAYKLSSVSVMTTEHNSPFWCVPFWLATLTSYYYHLWWLCSI